MLFSFRLKVFHFKQLFFISKLNNGSFFNGENVSHSELFAKGKYYVFFAVPVKKNCAYTASDFVDKIYLIIVLTKILSSRYNLLKTCFGMTPAIISLIVPFSTVLYMFTVWVK